MTDLLAPTDNRVMASNVVNLRSARKAKARAEKAAKAEENRAKFGRTKSDRLRDERATKHQAQELDGKKIETLPKDRKS